MELTDLAYAAGLLDGEGTLTLTRKGGSSPFRYPVVSISSTTPELLYFMKEKFGGCISNHKTYQPHHLKSYSWKLVGTSAITFCGQVRPFIKVPEKIRRADLILLRYSEVTVRNGKYSASQIAAKLAFEEEFLHPSTP